MGWVHKHGIRIALLALVVALALSVFGAGTAGANVAAPGGQWFWQNPMPQGNDLAAGWFVDTNTGCAVGTAGTILTTADGGATWIPRASGVEQYLNDVVFADSANGWVVGDTGTILATVDGGKTWVPQASGVTTSLRAVFALDDVHLIAVGDAGTMLVTADKGATWTPQASSTFADLNAVTFQSANNGWAVGSGGVIMRTNNGGLTWFPEVSGTAQDLHDIVFTNLYEGWAVGMNATVRHTSNGGSTWSAQDPGTSEDLNDIAAVNASDLWIGATGGEAAHSTDGGANWDAVDPGLGASFNAIIALSTTDVRVLGSEGAYARTLDGETWTQLWWTTTPRNLRDLAVTYGGRGWAVGETGAIITTSSNGANWYRQVSGVAQMLNGVDAVVDTTIPTAPVTRVWAVGNRSGAGNPGTILMTTDGGVSWQAQACPVNQNINDVHMADIANGWAVGANGSIVVTSSGGAVWTAQVSGVPGIALNGTDCTDSLHGWAVGDGGTIRYTVNGGANWIGSAVPGTAQNLRAVDMVDLLTGYAVGDNGAIVKTVDGGLNWAPQTSNTGEALYNVAFSDTGNGWAVGANGTLLRTIDGGTTWTLQSWMVDNDLRAVASFTDLTPTTFTWLAGSGGTVLSDFNPNLLGVTNLKADAGDTKIKVSLDQPRQRLRWRHGLLLDTALRELGQRHVGPGAGLRGDRRFVRTHRAGEPEDVLLHGLHPQRRGHVVEPPDARGSADPDVQVDAGGKAVDTGRGQGDQVLGQGHSDRRRQGQQDQPAEVLGQLEDDRQRDRQVRRHVRDLEVPVARHVQDARADAGQRRCAHGLLTDALRDLEVKHGEVT